MLDAIKNQLRPLKKLLNMFVNYSYPSTGLTWSQYWKWHLKYSNNLLKFKNIHKDKSCFIIGNGPSLNKMDLSPIKNYYTFGLNKIYLMLKRVDLNLSYHVSINRFVIEQSIKEFQSLKCPSFLSYKAAQNIIEDFGKNTNFILTGESHYFQRDLILPVSEGYTVTYVAMQIAYYMGFKEVFLIGVDHNFPTAQGKPNQKQFLSGKDLNHFDSNYFGNQEWQLPDLQASELSYHLAQFYFNRAGGNIYDATVDGKLQIFPKISYEQALDMCTKK